MLNADNQIRDNDHLNMLECGEMTWLEHVPVSHNADVDGRKPDDVVMERWLQSMRCACGV